MREEKVAFCLFFCFSSLIYLLIKEVKSSDTKRYLISRYSAEPSGGNVGYNSGISCSNCREKRGHNRTNKHAVNFFLNNNRTNVR